MKYFSIPSNETDLSAPTISIPSQKITWAGEGLQDDRFLFGTDNGLVLECGIHGFLENMHSIRVAKDEESINAIAFYFDEKRPSPSSYYAHRYHSEQLLRESS